MSREQNRAGKTVIADRFISLLGEGSSQKISSMIERQQSIKNNQIADFLSKCQVEIYGSREVGINSTTLTARVLVDGVVQTGPEFTVQDVFQWARPNHAEGFTPVKGNILTVNSSDIVEDPELFSCTWTYKYSGGVKQKVASAQISYALIRMYAWSNAESENELIDITESDWTYERTVQPVDKKYVWIRESSDNGNTWTYYRETGLEGKAWSTATLNLYKRSDSVPDPFDGGVVTYTFKTASFSGDLGTWFKTPPAAVEGTQLYTIIATAFSDDESDTISPSEWTQPQLLSESGSQGNPGLSVVTVFLFKLTENRPTPPSGECIYSITSKQISGTLDGWTLSVPTTSSRVWVTLATVATAQSTATIISSAWSNPEIFREKGDDGVGISSIVKEFAVSSSPVIAPENGWSPVYPARKPNQWIWAREKTTYTNGNITYSTPYVTTGDKGDNAKTLLMSVNSNMFRYYSDGTPYENQEIKIIVTKQNITETTIFTASNGMEIENNSSVITLTPAMMGNVDILTITATAGQYSTSIVIGKVIDGKDAYKPISQYAWHSSNTVQPVASIWTWGKSFMLWGGQFISSGTLWSNTIPSKPEGHWYLWIRWSTDGGQTWGKPACISGNDGDPAIGYEITYSPSTYQMTNRYIVKRETSFIFTLKVFNIPVSMDTVYWNVSTSLVKGEDWDFIENDPKRIKVTIPLNFEETQFSVSCKVKDFEEYEDMVTVKATIIEDTKAEYLHVVDVLPEQGPNATPLGYLRQGDYVLLQLETGERIPYTWRESSSDSREGSWQKTTGTDSNYAEIMSGVLADAIKGPITQESLSAMYGFFENLVVNTGFIKMLFAQYIEILGVIFGGGYDKDGNKRNGDQPGFHLSAITGTLKAVGALLNDVTVSSYDGSYLLLNTVKSVSGAKLNTTINNSYWSVAELYDAIPNDASLTLEYNNVNYQYRKNPSDRQEGSAYAYSSGGGYDSDRKTFTYPVYGKGYINLYLSVSTDSGGTTIGGNRGNGSIDVYINRSLVCSLNRSSKTYKFDVNKGDVVSILCNASANSLGGSSDPSSGSGYASASASFVYSYESESDYILLSNGSKRIILDKDDQSVRNDEVIVKQDTAGAVWKSSDNLKYAEYSSLVGFLDTMPINTELTVQQDSDYIRVLKDGEWVQHSISSFYYTESQIVFNTSDDEHITLPLNTYVTKNIMPISDVGPAVEISLTVNEIKGALEFGPMVPYSDYSAIGTESKRVPVIYAISLIANQITADAVYGAVFN